MTYYKCGSIHPTQNSNVVVDTASGAVANFDTSLALPLKSLEVDVNATQEAGTPTPQSPKAISGVSAVSVYHKGANLFNISTKTNGKALKWNDGDTFTDAQSIASDYIEAKEGAKFTSNYNAQWCCYDKNKNYLGNIVSGSLVTTSGNDTTTNTIPSGYGVYYLRLGFRSSTNNNSNMTEKTDIVLSVGNIALPYEAYNGSTTLINLGGTYYGGHFTQDKDGKRQFKNTVCEPIDTNTLLFYKVTTSGQTCFYADLPHGLIKEGGSSTFFGLCSNYKVIKRADMNEDNTCRFYAHTDWGGFSRVMIRDDYASEMTNEEFREYVSGKICYEIDNPTTIDLPDSTPIKSLPGINNIFCDTGDTSLQFRKIG